MPPPRAAGSCVTVVVQARQGRVGAGLTTAGRARLRTVVQQHVHDAGVPGVVALVAAREQVHVEAAGVLTVGGWDDPQGSWSRPQAFADSAAGLVSTVDDLHAFTRMLLRSGTPFCRRMPCGP